MRYKVFDKITNKDITDNPALILKPNGGLKLNDFGDEISITNCKIRFYPTESDDFYIDEEGNFFKNTNEEWEMPHK